MCKVFVRRRRTKTLHIIKKKARLRAKPGEEATFEKQSASILHRQMRSCILAIAENQNMQRVDALGKKDVSIIYSKYRCLLGPGKEDIMTIEVFISYSHKDQTFREELEIHLSNLKRQNIITSWYDGNIAPGAELEPQIMDHLKSAQIILLLISADFIHSDFCYSIEMKQAIDRHNAGEARVIPILLRPTDWQDTTFDKLQMLPTGAKAVTKWRRRDDAFTNIVQGIRASIHDLTNTGKTANPSIVSDTTSQEKTQSEQIWNIPYQRNLLFTGREDVLKKLSEALKSGKTATLAQPQAISGLGGIGKTQTAVEYAYRYKDDYKATLWVKAETVAS